MLLQKDHPLYMKNKKLIRFVQSLILLPVVGMGGGANLGNLPNKAPDLISRASQIVFSQDIAQSDSSKEEAELEAKILKIKAEAIDNYFETRGMPLAGMGEKMVIEAEKNGLDWRLVAAISVRETTGGKFDCTKNDKNPFGWGSCKISFNSYEEAIETVARNLGGNNPKTARHYANKNTKQILQTYNPPSIVLRYADQVIKIMDTIGEAEVTLEAHSNA